MIFFQKKYLPFITLFLIVLISRIPFLSAGYGVEEDSWGIALAAFHTKLSGIYEPSRLPGHPVQELIYSVLWGAGPVVFNGLCALFSAIGVVVFALILKQLNFKHFFIASLAFAFVPVYFISSTYTIDFVWTETFVLIALYYLLKNKFISCGIFLGLAIGCRITSGAMLLPFMIICWQNNDLKQNAIHLIKMIVPITLITILVFMPIMAQFGFSFFMFYDQFPYPPISKVLYKITIGVVGFIGVIAIGAAIVAIVFNKKKQNIGAAFENKLDKKIILASFVIIVLYTISYFRLPQKSGYMIPVIPFMILLLGYYLNSKNFKLLCVAFILSPFLCSINLTDTLRGATHSNYSVITNVAGQELFFDPLSGPLFSDYSKRKQKMKYTEMLIEKTNDIKSKTVIIAGWWYNEAMVEMISHSKNNFVTFESYINSLDLNKYKTEGYAIVYLPEQKTYNELMFKNK
jgi:hypothetical protein